MLWRYPVPMTEPKHTTRIQVNQVVAAEEPNRVLLTLAMSKEDAEKVLARFQAGDLASLGVLDLTAEISGAKKWGTRHRKKGTAVDRGDGLDR